MRAKLARALALLRTYQARLRAAAAATTAPPPPQPPLPVNPAPPVQAQPAAAPNERHSGQEAAAHAPGGTSQEPAGPAGGRAGGGAAAGPAAAAPGGALADLAARLLAWQLQQAAAQAAGHGSGSGSRGAPATAPERGGARERDEPGASPLLRTLRFDPGLGPHGAFYFADADAGAPGPGPLHGSGAGTGAARKPTSERSSSGACACSHGAEAAGVPGPPGAQDTVTQQRGSEGGGAAEQAQALPAGDERRGEGLWQGSEGGHHHERLPAVQQKPTSARCSQDHAGKGGRCEHGSEHTDARGAPAAAPANGAAAVETLAGSWAAPGRAEAQPPPAAGEPAAAAARLTERLPRLGGGCEEGGGAPGAGARERASAVMEPSTRCTAARGAQAGARAGCVAAQPGGRGRGAAGRGRRPARQRRPRAQAPQARPGAARAAAQPARARTGRAALPAVGDRRR